MKLLSENKILVEVLSDERINVLKTLLCYLHYSDELYYYILFGYNEYSANIDRYKIDYPELKEDSGFFKLKRKDIFNAELISDILIEFQIASLYINKLSDLVEKYDFAEMRHLTSTYAGYVIEELTEDYIIIEKGESRPDWDLNKMGV